MSRKIIARWSHSTHSEVPLDYTESKSGLQIVRDIEPYQSMITGERIRSRSHHKMHLRDHGCIEVGNEKMETKKQKRPSKRREILHRQLADMPHETANRILRELKEQH
jgi:hypothetical protein